MKRILIACAMLAIVGCAQAKRQEAAVQQRDAAMDAATKRMVVVTANDVPGHSDLATLGLVQGNCGTDPRANDIVNNGDG
ncbi:MAG TPA: hypothetical protein VIX12_09460, partial [Candidatus Binataceae bacterium]